jgi:hypothetical protein
MAYEDPVVANLKQEMREMKNMMHALLQAGVECVKHPKPKNTFDKGKRWHSPGRSGKMCLTERQAGPAGKRFCA